jgi:PIN domain nuclease of toxin-antitoxin system
MSEVWDASAVLAVLNREPGWEALLEGWATGSISAVSLAEVAAKLAERGMPEHEVRQVLDAIELKVYAFDAVDALRAGMLRPLTKALGLSLGDRACLALGLRLESPVLTTDRVWKDLDLPLEIRLGR